MIHSENAPVEEEKSGYAEKRRSDHQADRGLLPSTPRLPKGMDRHTGTESRKERTCRSCEEAKDDSAAVDNAEFSQSVDDGVAQSSGDRKTRNDQANSGCDLASGYR